MYSDLENNYKNFEIKSTLPDTKQGNFSVTEYFNNLGELPQELLQYKLALF